MPSLVKSIVICLLLLTSSRTVFADAYEMILIGGALHTCSSMSQHRCDDIQFSESKTTTLYSIHETSIHRLDNFIKNNTHSHPVSALAEIVEKLTKNKPVASVTRRDLFDHFESLDVLDSVDSLSDFEYYALLDFLEDAQQVEGKRLKEIARPMASKSDAAVEIWNEISKQVLTIITDNENKRALAVTASARDNFEAVDFYVGGLSAIGLNAEWLPVSAALLDAINARKSDETACQKLEYFRQKHYQFDRARVYPDLHEIQLHYCENPEKIAAKIEEVSAIFFNGGDQSKALAAFVQKDGSSTSYLDTLREQVAKKEILIVGTSAGTAVQSGGAFNEYPTVMISNGTSSNAMTRGVFGIEAPSQRCVSDNCNNGIQGGDLTYRTLGGLANFSLGVMDTHFSERNREARLIALTQETRNSFGFGVDETTALMVSKTDDKNYEFKVIGSQGVFIADNSFYENAASKQVEGTNNTYAGFAHFFPAGTVASLSTDTMQWQVKFNQSTQVKKDDEATWRNNADALCRKPKQNQKQFSFDDYSVVLAINEQTKIYQSDERCGYLFMSYAVASN